MNEPPSVKARIVVDPGHPALDGHFPGNPLLPGVAVLDEVIAAAEAWLGKAWRVRGLPQVKFLSPLRPGEAADVHLELREGHVHFVVQRGETAIARGILSPGDGKTGP